ncbi:tetratricopeptide repeat-containing sensor histidine kinase [Polaribacter cellanae]|uniref:tetratricopeptide repeat-containing sensor histidine kinase n=1 Tax=Polaribacter cellanae TaxID=2818493 RepID=UPI001FB80085|nr:histidine kinase [Polaribacter cellanae]
MNGIFFAQQNEDFINRKEFFVKVVVASENSGNSITNANVSINGNQFRYSDFYGYYRVKAKVNDELVITHPDFETVYHIIKSDEEIKILVKDFPDEKYSTSRLRKSKSVTDNFYLQHLDSAKYYAKKDIEKSLTFIEKALKTNNSRERNAATYKTLADIYLFWKQYDLAIYNYKLSNQIYQTIDTRIKLAEAQFLLKDLESSKKTYEQLEKEKLRNFQKILILEGLADIAFENKDYKEAKKKYQQAFKVARDNGVTSKITDLTSKLGTVFSAEGNLKQANLSFKNSLNFAEKENETRVLEEEEKVADFLNSNKKYDEEIALRKKSLEKTKSKKIVSNEVENIQADSITSQKINYKIGNAYILKEEYKEAIPFLEKSRTDAKENNDIVVEKDATRKISEVFANLGEYDKALKNYEKYVSLVDSLYVRKEQEIQQAKRLSKKIADNQNRIASLEKDKELTQSKISLAYVDQKLAEENNRRQRLIIYSLIGGFLLMCLLAYFMYRTNKQQKLANNLLALKSMRSQMNPHFIFNALNSVNSFIAVNDERNANRYLSEFSVLMRSVLENSDEDFIPLTKEVELLELYVKLEHNRFKDKFDYQINVDKNIKLDQFSIPPMLLQPYIENAIWHGLRYKKEKGNLKISIKQKDVETISILIMDDGIGRKHSQKLKTKNQLKQKSKGISTIQNRIAILNDMYKDRISVEISNVLETGEGTKVELILKKA